MMRYETRLKEALGMDEVQIRHILNPKTKEIKATEILARFDTEVYEAAFKGDVIKSFYAEQVADYLLKEIRDNKVTMRKMSDNEIKIRNYCVDFNEENFYISLDGFIHHEGEEFCIKDIQAIYKFEDDLILADDLKEVYHISNADETIEWFEHSLEDFELHGVATVEETIKALVEDDSLEYIDKDEFFDWYKWFVGQEVKTCWGVDKRDYNHGILFIDKNDTLIAYIGY